MRLCRDCHTRWRSMCEWQTHRSKPAVCPNCGQKKPLVDCKNRTVPKIGTVIATRATPQLSDFYCRGSKSGCVNEGWKCAGHERGSCSGFVCRNHAVIGSSKPFLKKTICRVCETRQFGTLSSDQATTKVKSTC